MHRRGLRKPTLRRFVCGIRRIAQRWDRGRGFPRRQGEWEHLFPARLLRRLCEKVGVSMEEETAERALEEETKPRKVVSEIERTEREAREAGK